MASVRALAVLGALTGFSCSSEPEVRRQLVVFVDTTAPIVGELADHPELSADLAIDSLRVDALGPNGEVGEVREFIVPDPLDWPLSFGVAAPSATNAVRLRLRAFRANRSDAERIGGQAASRPWKETTIDRLIDLDFSGNGVTEVHVVLEAGCVGAPVNLFEPASTCVDAERLSARPDAALSPSASPRAWADFVVEAPCRAAPVTGRVCIPGGYSVLGDTQVSILFSGRTADSVPLRPVRFSPFWMDETEFTVGRFRQLVREGRISGALAQVSSSGAGHLRCTWRGPDRAEMDAYALSCVTLEAARAICNSVGGYVPSEARFEHAARGRGQARQYPWGSTQPDCCTASLDRPSDLPFVPSCPGVAPEPVASHRPSAACGGLGDVSRDGVLDLGGGLGELTLDVLSEYTDPCWTTRGALVDPVCQDPEKSLGTHRGGNWTSGLQTALGALRWSSNTNVDYVGFRCVYEDTP